MGTRDRIGYNCTARPCRVAFVVDLEHLTPATLGEISNWCCTTWGGSFSPILPVVNGEIPPFWRTLARHFDPDVLTFIGDVPEPLCKELIREHCPFGAVGCGDTAGRPARILIDRLRGLRFEIAEFARAIDRPGHWTERPVLFDIYRKTEATGNDLFAILNGGVFLDGIPNHAALDGVQRRDRIESEQSERLLVRMRRPDQTMVWPNDFGAAFCKAPCYVGKRLFDGEFVVVVGDDPMDFVLAWTIAQLDRCGKSAWWSISDASFYPQLRACMWIPTRWLDDQKVLQLVGEVALRSGINPTPVPVHAVSTSVDPARLDLLAQAWEIRGLAPQIALKSKLVIDWRTTGLDCHWAFDLEDMFFDSVAPVADGHIRIEGVRPRAPQTRSCANSWVLDVNLQGPPMTGQRGASLHRLKLPRRRSLAAFLTARDHSRITALGDLSMLMRGDDARLSLVAPARSQVLAQCIQTDRGDVTGALLAPVERNGFVCSFTSTPARRVSAVLDLFGGLESAHHFLGNPWWTAAFERLAGVESRVSLVAETTETLVAFGRALLDQSLTNPDSARSGLRGQAEDLAPSLLPFVRRCPFEPHDKLLGDAFRSHQGRPWGVAQKDFKSEWHSELAFLLKCGVLSRGLLLRCPQCSAKDVYSTDLVSESTVCLGCRTPFQPPSDPKELKWAYTLNTIVCRTMAERDDLPVILTLKELSERTAPLLWRTQVTIYEPDPTVTTADADGFREKTDIDILAVGRSLDNPRIGELFAVEVKSRPEFKADQMAEFADVCRRISVDRVLLAAVVCDPAEEAELARQAAEASDQHNWGEAKVQAFPIRPKDRASGDPTPSPGPEHPRPPETGPS